MREQIINLTSTLANTLKSKLGIDAGASLTKISYVKDDKLIFKSFLTNYNEIYKFLNENQEFKINLTGGKAFKIYKNFNKDKNCQLINEFEAQCRGVEVLFELNEKKMPLDMLFISVGTGTSMLHIKSQEDRRNFERIGGSALGGGTFMGLIKLLYNLDDFNEAINIAKKGNPYNVDLKVGDIYENEDDRVDPLFRQFTASSLGKVTLFNDISYKKEDVINSIISIISENIASQLILYSQNRKVKNLVFSGGFLKNNSIFKRIIKIMCKMHKKKPYFLKYNDMVSAIGALRS